LFGHSWSPPVDGALLRANAGSMRAMFVVYVVLIVAGIAFYSVIGLIHN
jgi:hypothetical protein